METVMGRKRVRARGNDYQGHDGQEFAQHQMAGLDGQGQQHFQGAALLLLAPLTHGQGRHQEDHQEGQTAEQGAHIGDAAGEERVDQEEGQQHQPQECAHKDQRHGRAKIAVDFFASDGEGLFHGEFSQKYVALAAYCVIRTA